MVQLADLTDTDALRPPAPGTDAGVLDARGTCVVLGLGGESGGDIEQQRCVVELEL